MLCCPQMANRRAVLVLVSCVFSGSPALRAAPSVQPEVVERYPHATDAFTQGLVWHEGEFFESTGLRGSSTLRRVRLEDGAVLQRIELPADHFGEGLARVDDRLIQLTWQEQVAHVYDLGSFEQVASFGYAGEGWGLCHDGKRLVMSDGSASLFFRNPETFELLGEQTVTDAGVPITRLNELECAGGLVFANVWQTDTIVVIDPETGEVRQQVDAAGLLTAAEAAEADVLNGIAFDAATNRFFVTGKLWPALFDVRLAVEWKTGESPAARSSSCTLSPAAADSGAPLGVFVGFLVGLALCSRRRAQESDSVPAPRRLCSRCLER